METAVIALYILSIDGALVGMSLGVLLPLLLPGVCFGVSLALLIGSVGAIMSSYFFPIASGVLAALSAILSVRYVPTTNVS
jgi:callose synthase